MYNYVVFMEGLFMANFGRFNLKKTTLKTLSDIGFEKPTKIQELVIPSALKGKDIIGRSHTGSGKSHAFLIPIFNRVNKDENRVQAVILTPTRELATQIYEMAKPFLVNEPDIRVMLVSSGTDRQKMIEKVNTVPHIVIGTPGRIKDIAFVENAFNITSADILTLDEADMILEAGFIDDVSLIAGKMKSKLQMMVFSATIPEQLKQFLNKYMNNPLVIDPDNEIITAAEVKHIAYPTRNKNKMEVLYSLLNNVNPYLAIIFASRIEDVNAIYEYLKGKKLNVGVIHGDLDSTTRRVMMNRIKNNEFTYIVASDIAARGLDIEGVTHIFNYQLPFVEEYYFHRAGRTGRNGEEGVCITLYDKEELKYIERFIKLGVRFSNREFKDGKWVELKPLEKTQGTRKGTNPLGVEIKKIISKRAGGKVKPNYKKRINLDIEHLKKQHKRTIIENDIKRQIKERAIKRTKAEKGMSD